MTTYQIKGIVELVGETTNVGANGFTKREIVINTAAPGMTYPNPVKVTFKKDKCALADGLAAGDEVTVDVTIDGRKWDSPNGVKYFTDITGWKLAVTNAAAPGGGSADDADVPF